MAASRRLILDILARDRGARRTIEGVADAADDAAAELAGMGSAARKLDADLESTKAQMRGLAAEMAGLDRGSARFAQLRKEFSGLSRDASSLAKLRKTFGDIGADGAQGMSLSFSQRIGPLLAKAPISPALVAGFAAASPAVGAAVGAAVLAGLSAGTVAAGVKASFEHPSVKSAGQRLATDFKIALLGATREFVPATLRGIATLRAQIRSIGPDLRAVFAPAARYVEPLVRGFTGLVRGVLPGMASALRHAQPVVDALSDGMTLFGQQAGKALEAIGEGSAGASLALRDMLTGAAYGVRLLGETIGVLSKAYAAMRIVTGGGAQATADFAAAEVRARSFSDAVTGLSGGLGSYSGAAGTAAQLTRSLTDAQQDAADAALAAFDAETAFARAIREAGAAAKNASGGISLNTAKGLENREALSKLGAQIRKSVTDYEAQNGVTRRSVQMQAQGYAAFVRTARQMGATAAQARGLASAIGLIPGGKRTVVSTPGLSVALRDVRSYLATIRALPTQRNIRIVQQLVRTGVPMSGLNSHGGFTARASGGPVRRGQPYLVGEEGPELVVPSRSGTVVPAGPTQRIMTGRARAGAPAAGGDVPTIMFGGDREIATLIRRLIRNTSGLAVVVG